MRFLVPITAALLLGGCAAEPIAERDVPPTRSVASSIVNGTRSSSSQDSVVLLSIGKGGQFCSGVLIAPNLVLTARHCLQAADDSTACGPYQTLLEPSSITVLLGASAEQKTVAAHGRRTFVDSGATICSHDLALLQLDTDIPSATVATVRFGKVGRTETTKTVGYGADASGKSSGTRFQREALTISAIGPAASTYTTRANERIAFEVHAGELATGESTCFGDSGGPLFDAQDRVIATTSRGLDEQCVDRPSIYSATASHEAMIRDAATVAGHPLAIESTSDGPPDAPSAGGIATVDGATTSDGSTAAREPAASEGGHAGAGCTVGAPRSASTSRGAWGAIFAVFALVSRRRRSSVARVR